ncbi:MAG: ATP-binding protein [Bilophila wadsworthia]
MAQRAPQHPETRRVRDRAYLQFIVRDTGIGMETGLLERIFEPFEQGGLHFHSYGGSGLGLPSAATSYH